MKKHLINFYLDWLNNFLTVARLAEYYGITEEEARIFIPIGKKYHEASVTVKA